MPIQCGSLDRHAVDPLAAPLSQSAATSNPLRLAPAFTHDAGGLLLLVPLTQAGANLDAVVALNDTARRLWTASEGGLDEDGLVRWLMGQHMRAPAAQAEVAAFLQQLRAHGLAAAAPVTAAPPSAAFPSSQEDAAPVSAAQLAGLARAILTRGQRLFFRARGLSMRPQIPHGAVIEVSPCSVGRVRRGDVLLYVAGEAHLVAHRVLRHVAAGVSLRGDSAARVDWVSRDAVLGLVTARLEPMSNGWCRVLLDTRSRRLLGRLSSAAHRALRGALRLIVVRPLRARPTLRRLAQRGTRAMSWLLGVGEQRRARMRRRFDIATAALMTTAEKDERRRALYARASVRAFTALDENVEAGLTLIEEVMLARHPLPHGNVLVLGCGPGRECVALARLGHAVTGLDRDTEMLTQAAALAARCSVQLELIVGEADAFDLGAQRFAAVVAFSGLYNMVLPRARRVALLRCAATHLAAGGKVYLTFLSDYVSPGAPPPPRVKTLGSAIDDDHEDGDLWLRNEAVHIFPDSERLRREAEAAGLAVVTLFRDQRAYDRATRQVRGYAILEPRP